MLTTLLVLIGGLVSGLVVGGLAAYLLGGRRREVLGKSMTAGAILGIVAGMAWIASVPAVLMAADNVSPVQTPEQFDQLVLKADRPVIVDFYATWCGPCRTVGPRLSTLADEYAGRATFVKVDVDKSMELSAKYKIEAMPTVIIFVNGSPKGRLVGAYSIEQYRKAIDDAFAAMPRTQPAASAPSSNPASNPNR